MNNDSKCENRAMNFLLFSYFGVTADDDDELILNAAIKKAHADATMQGAYNAMFKKEDKDAKEASNTAAKECTEYLRKEIRNLSSISQDYKVWHNKVCQELIEIYAEKLEDKYQDYFSYGNAQKWINMLIKYLCIFNELGVGPDFSETLNSLKDELHVPIDSYILEAYCSNKDELSGLNQKKSNTPKAWSKMNWEDYEGIQGEIINETKKHYSNPMDWESKAWIAVAKKRKRKNQNKI